MGCCSSTKQPRMYSQKTLRDHRETKDLTEVKEENDVFRGRTAKNVVDDTTSEDLILAVKNGHFQLVEAICIKHRFTNVCEIKGFQGEFELLKRERYNLNNWNVMLLAIAFDNVKALQFFTQETQNHLRLGLRAPPIQGFSKMQESSPQQAECFSLLVALNQRNLNMIKYLWEELRLLWDNFHLQYILEEMANQKFVDGIQFILRSPTTHEIYLSLNSHAKKELIKNLIITNQTKRQLDVKELLKTELSQKPYSSVALFVMMNDPKGFSANIAHLETASENLEAQEYGRFKYTLSNFQNYVSQKILDYTHNQDSLLQQDFGKKLKAKLDNLDMDVFKLKGGFVSSLEYDTILTKKLFEFAQNGDIESFKQVCKDSDIRVFKRCEQQTVKFPRGLFNIESKGWFTPLLAAVQSQHLPIVQFIMEQMKVNLRETLCLYHHEHEESFMIGISEELQAYSLLVACHNRDEQMLQQLWGQHGIYLWTDRHFEPVMRLVIETSWIQGVRIMLQNETTHMIIKALSSDERSYFIENMIGDIFQFKNLELMHAFLQELSKKPYAGILILALMDKFLKLDDNGLEIWEISVGNLYTEELQVLAKTNSSRFAKFLVYNVFNRADDKYKQKAFLLVDKLKALPSFLPLIEEQDEEAFQLGDEELRFMKRDVKDSPFPYIIDTIKFSITGNVKQLQKLVEKNKLTGIDIYNIRGIQVKLFDTAGNMLNTRMWNPLHYAIFYRQVKVIEYLVKDLKVNLRVAFEQPYTSNEFAEDTPMKQLFGKQDTLYGYLVAIFSKDSTIFKYLFEQMQDQLQVDEFSLIDLMRLCLTFDFHQGFMVIINSHVTESIFMNSTLDFKEDFIQYVLSDEAIECQAFNSKKHESQIKEIKDRIVQFPFCAVSWRFLDPLTEVKNQRYMKILIQNFDESSMELLAQSQQLDKIHKRSLGLPEVQMSKNFENGELNEEEMKEMHEKIKHHNDVNQRWQEYQVSNFSKKIEQKLHEMKKPQDLQEACSLIVTKLLQRQEDEEVEEFKNMIEKQDIKFLQFLDGYHNQKMWKGEKRVSELQMERFNIIHWIIYYNKYRLLNYILKNYSSDYFQIGRVFTGDHAPYKYSYQTSTGASRVITINKLGLTLILLIKKQECFESLFRNCQGLLTPAEILDSVLVMCVEDWKSGLQFFEPYLLAAFSKSPMTRRIEFIHSILEIVSPLCKQVLSIPKIFSFLQWMQASYKSDQVARSDLVRTLLQKPPANPDKDKDMKFVKFLTRLLFAKRVNYDQDSVDVSDIRLEPSQNKPTTYKTNATYSDH